VKELLVSLLLLFLLQEPLQEAEPEIVIDVGTVVPNQVAVIRVTVTNPNTADMLWGNTLKIEEVHPFFVPLQSEYILSHEIRPGQTDIGELTFQVTREAKAGEYPLTISLSGGVGACEEGCVPYFIEKEVSIRVIRDEPKISVSHTIQGTQIAITLTNTGTGEARAVLCDETTVGTILPGKSTEIYIDKKSTFTVEYEDEYGKKFTQSFRISEKKQEASFQSVLVVIGIFLGYFFKRSTN